MALLFTYGTLKKGYTNHSVMSNAKFIGVTVTEPLFTMYNLGRYPAITLSGSTAIVGEVYEVDDLYRTDVLEGYPTFYDRVEIDTEYGRAWVYYCDAPSHCGIIIESGEWIHESTMRLNDH